MYDESFDEAWRLGYGREPGSPIQDLTPFLRHRSVRKYSDKPVSEEQVSSLVACGHPAATSRTLHLSSIVSEQDPENRAELATLCSNYNHIRTAKWFLCFIADHYRLKEAAAKVGEDS